MDLSRSEERWTIRKEGNDDRGATDDRGKHLGSIGWTGAEGRPDE